MTPDSKKWLDKLLSTVPDPMYQKELKRKIDQPGYLHKLGIIRDCIYGVDIQSIAVEISKLRCFLSLIVDEKVDDSKPNRGIEHLPNLEFKFVSANTLIGLPKLKYHQGDFEGMTKGASYDVEKEIKKLQDLRATYLISFGDEKAAIEKEFMSIQSKLFEHSLRLNSKDSRAIALASWKPFKNEPTPWFDPEWMFGIKNGFDIVIANPPYVQIKQIPWDDRKIYEEKFASAVGRFNLFYFFLELSGSLAKQSGISTFIVPDRLLLNTQCDQLRKWLLKEQTILELDSFSEGVFEAVVDSIIIFYRNAKSEAKEVKVKNRVTLDNLVQSTFVNIPVSYFLNSPSNQFDLSYDISTAKLLEKIKSQSVPLGGISDIKDGIIQGKVTDKLFLDKSLDKDSKPLLFGEDVTKYSIRFNSNWVNYKPIEMMRIEVKRRGEGVRHGLWMRIPEIFERNKILTRQTADEIIAAYDTENYYYSNTLHGTTILDKQYHPLYVLAILNSKLITWYYRSTTAEEGKVFAQIKIELLRLLPIKKEINGKQKPFISLVDKIIVITKSDDYQNNKTKQAEVQKLEAQIDEMVYKLYDLTPEEIGIVDPSSSSTSPRQAGGG